MRRLLLLSPIAAALALTIFWALAQPAPQPMPSLFPAGALLYLEAKDFGALLADWNGSAEKQAWLASANYDAFSRSELFLKLSDAQTQFATAAGVPPDYVLLSSVAGSNSAVAVYDIGKLEFLFVTHVPSARAMNTSLWKARGTYQTRHAGNADYFVKEDKPSHRVAAFAYTGDSLLLATKEELIAGALRLMAREALPSVASETWFSNSVQAAATGSTSTSPSDLRLVYNMTALARTFQFRSHWVQNNVPDLRQFSSGFADLERARGQIHERRVLLRSAPAEAADNEAATGQLLAAIPDDAGLYRAWLHPAGVLAEQWMEEKVFPTATASAPPSKSAPVVVETQSAGSEVDLESRIDERPITENRDSFKGLRDLLVAARIDAMLDVSSTRIDASQVFVEPHSAIALLANTAWNADAIRAALGTAAEGTWSNSAAATWRTGAGGVRELDGLGKLAMASDGKWLVIGDSAEMVNAVFARRNRPAPAGAAYAAGWRHARELPNFERMTKLIDFPQMPVAAADQPEGAGEPPFFSGNLASLGRTLKRIDAATIVVHDEGSLLRESVVYKLIP
jgi:hypothetical protein